MASTQDNYQVPLTYFEWEFADPEEARFVTDGYIKHAKGEGQIAILLEPFFLHPENYMTAIEKNFDYVLSHNHYFVINNPGWLWYPYGGSSISPDLWKVYEKNKNVSMISTQKSSTTGHKMRREISAKYSGKLDGVFGEKEFTRSFDCLSNFRFSVVIENEKSQFWFTEKLIDCFSVGTIPIYWGCEDVGYYFNPEGIIQFDYMGELPNILAEADERHYLDKLKAAKDNLETARRYSIPENWIYAHYPFLFEKG